MWNTKNVDYVVVVKDSVLLSSLLLTLFTDYNLSHTEKNRYNKASLRNTTRFYFYLDLAYHIYSNSSRGNY